MAKKPRNESSGKMSPWKNAGLMLSYWCSASCEFCYVSSCPEHTKWADADRVVKWWQELEAMQARNGEHVKIHLTGGEVFGNWDLLVDVLDRAQKAGLPPVDKIETNSFWATNDEVVRERFLQLKDFGVGMVTSDADIFHQQYVPIENVQRVVTIGREILGEEAIRVRWWDFYDFAIENDLDVSQMSGDEIREFQVESLSGRRERLNGRAGVLASKILTGEPPEAFADEKCERGILKSKHVHIDPHGNIFPGTCCGIVLGNAISEDITNVFDWLNKNGPTGPVLESLVESGPCGLIKLASRYGFTPLPQGYASKCQLCYHLRHTLYKANQGKKWVSPAECYPDVEW